jgi:uncharacterized membrane protein YfcA
MSDEIVGPVDLLYVLSGLAVGTLVGMTGMGGGSLMTPLLILVFGIHPVTAVGTDLLFAASTKTVGTVAHGASGTIRWRIVGLLAGGSVPATIASLFILERINLQGAHAQRITTIVLGTALLLTSLFLFGARPIRQRFGDRLAGVNPAMLALLTILVGFAVGFLVSFTSIGAGAMGVTALLLLYPRLPTSMVVGSDIAHAVPLTLLAGAGHWLIGAFNGALLIPLLLGSLPGVVLGAYLGRHVPEGALRLALAIALCGVGVKLVW